MNIGADPDSDAGGGGATVVEDVSADPDLPVRSSVDTVALMPLSLSVRRSVGWLKGMRISGF